MQQQQRTLRERHRTRKAKILFYAGIKSDGSPRGWSYVDIFITAFCVAMFLCCVVMLLDWMWGATSFPIGK